MQSEYEEIGQIELSQSDLDELQRHVVFCHNDLEPRNILMRKVSSGGYELASIIDWQMTDFSPLAYVYGFKNTVVGSSIRHVSKTDLSSVPLIRERVPYKAYSGTLDHFSI